MDEYRLLSRSLVRKNMPTHRLRELPDGFEKYREEEFGIMKSVLYVNGRTGERIVEIYRRSGR